MNALTRGTVQMPQYLSEANLEVTDGSVVFWLATVYYIINFQTII